MAKRILSIIKSGKPYQINNNITLDNKIILPKDTEVWEDEI